MPQTISVNGKAARYGQPLDLRNVGAISADHDELAMRDVEHAEQAEDHGKAKSEDRKRGDGVEDVDRLGDDQRIHF